MAGIYIHIPFCKQKCNYCDFYSVVSATKKVEFLKCLLKEIESRFIYLKEKKVETIYLGGGTPSLLDAEDLELIINSISKHFCLSSSVETNLEANPENITKAYLQDVKKIGINRLSMGVQSFSETDLKFLKRAHSSQQAISAVKIAQDLGLENISLDLIYGLPNSTLSSWEKNLQMFFSLNVLHLSAYHLTYEQGTALYHHLNRGKIRAVEEDVSIGQFQMLMDYTKQNAFEMYEISNFAKDKAYSKHNTSYWQQKPYLGLGPSAHSFNLEEREWNASNLNRYMNGIQNEQRNYEKEVLSKVDLINEYLITRLRTKWGIQKADFKSRFDDEVWQKIVQKANKYIQNKMLLSDHSRIKLSPKGIFISDKILEDLLVEE